MGHVCLHGLAPSKALEHCARVPAFTAGGRLQSVVAPSEEASRFPPGSDLSFPLTDAAAYLFCVAETNQQILAVSTSICFIL